MNVCYIITSTIKCGPVNVLYGILKNYKKINKFNPYLIVLKDDDPQRSMRDEFRRLGIKISQFDFTDSKKINNFIKENDIDIIHSHGLKPDIVNSTILKKNPGKYVHITTLHNYPFKDYITSYGKIKGYLMAKFHLIIMASLNKVACSYAIADDYWKYKHVETNVIENGVIFPKESELLSSKNNKKLTFLFLGDVRKRKHIDFLINYFKKHSDYEFLVVGDGEEYQKIRELSLGIKNIKILGRTYSPEKFYKTVDYYISDSEAEGLPMSVLESLSWGTPVIVSDIESHKEVIEQGNNFGKLFALDDEKSLNNAINSIKIKKSDTKEIYINAKKIFSSDKMMENYFDLYKKLLDRTDVNFE